MYYCKSFVVTLLFVIITVLPLHADGTHPQGVKLDGTIGSAGQLELQGPDYDIRADYGHQAGGNLFHSFSQFNVHSGESASFSGPDSVRNIISRVTGGDPSWINGNLGSVIPNADMYFLNPAGVMFGPNASLSLGGSFHVSTADYLRMGEDERFNSIPGESDVLSVSAPTAFGFLDNDVAPVSFESRGRITVQEWEENPSGLYVADGKTISIVGGDIEIKNGTSFEIPIFDRDGNLIFIQKIDEFGNPKFETEVDENGNPVLDENGEPVYKLDENGEMIPVYVLDEEGNPVFRTRIYGPGDIKAFDGRLNMAAVGSEGEVVLKEDDLDASSFVKMGTIKISEGVTADLNGIGGGAVYIRAGQFDVDGSIVKSNTVGEGKGTGIDIEADDLKVTGGGGILCGTYASGDGGNIKIRVKDLVVISGENSSSGRPSNIEASTQDWYDMGGKAGMIELEAGQLEVSDGAQISSASHGSGQGGEIKLRVSDTVSVFGEGNYVSGILSEAQGQNEQAGNGGDIKLTTRKLQVTGGALITTSSWGAGHGGNINIQAYDSVTLSGENSFGNGSSIFANTEGAGKGGSIELTAGTLNLSKGAQIASTTFGTGQGGNIKLQIENSATLSGEGSLGYTSAIVATSQDKTEGGDSGKIELAAEKLYLNNGAQILATTFGTGVGGSIQLDIKDSVTLSGQGTEEPSGILVNALGETNAGEGGTIELATEKLQISQGAQIASRTVGTGKGGSIKLQVKDSVTISDKGTGEYPSGIYADTTSESEYAGEGGTIELTANTLELNESGRITTSSLGTGIAGDINLQIDQLKLNNNASVVSASNAKNNGGNAGTVTVTANDSISLSGNSTLNTDAQSAGGGIIKINAKNKLALSDASISTDVMQGTGNGGDISIGTPEFVILDQGEITANADIGDGGAIFIHTENYIKSTDSKVTAKSNRGNDGTVKIQAPDMDISSSLMLLPSGYIDASKWMKTPCAVRTGQNVSRFLIKGRDAKAFTPEDWFPGCSYLGGR